MLLIWRTRARYTALLHVRAMSESARVCAVRSVCVCARALLRRNAQRREINGHIFRADAGASLRSSWIGSLGQMPTLVRLF